MQRCLHGALQQRRETHLDLIDADPLQQLAREPCLIAPAAGQVGVCPAGEDFVEVVARLSVA